MEVASRPIRVQSIAQNGTAPQVPPEYIQPPETRPNNPTARPANNNPIPSIDLNSAVRDADFLRTEIGAACRDWGAFHVTNHGVPPKLLGEVRRVGRTFFEACPMDEKLRYSCDTSGAATEGYGSRMLVASNDTVLDWRDYFDHHTLPVSRRDPSRWPQFPPDYREVMVEYSDHMKALAQKLLGLISESLGLPSSCIEEAVGEFYQNISINYYPPCPQPDLTLGLQAHSDMGAITLLIQDDVGGLQVFKDDEWITVDPLSDAIFVILSDQTEIISNGKYRSAQHRAITNGSRARLSVSTFHDPAKTKAISPAFEPPKYHTAIYGDYVLSWYSNGPEGKRNIDALLI
ncbi:hypothetical protein RJ640_002400 [Escallonia rubra]|uniref:Fe2OG dioxygenase domain-containing protein n=1 Tax=Escallonia rubra TaxID=112253 RepID=A0AA88UWP6_9ASTE|nr:hypothetical protein RJ640_002400 [Escallonia rubra]